MHKKYTEDFHQRKNLILINLNIFFACLAEIFTMEVEREAP